MPRKPSTLRQLELRAAEQRLKAEQSVLKEQQARVAAARRAVAALTSCDQCGGRQALPTQDGEWVCWPCAQVQIVEARRLTRKELLRPIGPVALQGMTRVG